MFDEIIKYQMEKQQKPISWSAKTQLLQQYKDK